MWTIGHRGSAGTHPENTLLSIDHAVQCGADWIEIDVRLIDGSFIVLHDETLDRTTDGSGPVEAYTLADLRALDAGDGERIPLLAEVMELIDARAGLNIEVKQAHDPNALIALTTQFAQRQPKWQNRILISSFDAGFMRTLHAASPADQLLGALSHESAESAIALARDINAYSAHFALRQLSEKAVASAHAYGLRVFVYTVNEIADIGRCRALAVDGIFTDYPGRLSGALDNETN